MLGKLQVPGRPTFWITVGQGPIALAVGAGGGCLDVFTLVYHFSFLSPSLWETIRYRLKYCLKGSLSPNNQPTNQHNGAIKLSNGFSKSRQESSSSTIFLYFDKCFYTFSISNDLVYFYCSIINYLSYPRHICRGVYSGCPSVRPSGPSSAS